MIIQKLGNAKLDGAFESDVQKALEYVRQHDLAACEPGRVEIDGDRMFAVVQRYDTAPEAELAFESHDLYADVQCMLAGRERILLCHRSEVGAVSVAYDAAGDITFYRDPAVVATELALEAGDYAVFMPWDCHKTRCDADGCTGKAVRKVIVKIKLSNEGETTMSEQKIGFHHLCIRAKDYNVSKKFYTEVLGAKCYAEWKHWKDFMACMMELNDGGIIEMLGSGEDALPQNFESISGCFIHLALHVEDVEKAVAKAIACGATPKGEIKINDIPSRMQIGAVNGPSGEIIEFLKPLDA